MEGPESQSHTDPEEQELGEWNLVQLGSVLKG